MTFSAQDPVSVSSPAVAVFQDSGRAYGVRDLAQNRDRQRLEVIAMGFAALSQWVLRFGAVIAFPLLAECAFAQTNTAQFEYLPEYSVGELKATMHPRRFLEVSWKGRNLLTQGGEIFTRVYRETTVDGTRIPGGPLGYYELDDTQPEFDIPVRVEQTTNGLVYSWVCDAAMKGYRQVICSPRPTALIRLCSAGRRN